MWVVFVGLGLLWVVCWLVGNGEVVGRCGLVLVGLVVLVLGIGGSGVWGRSLLG